MLRCSCFYWARAASLDEGVLNADVAVAVSDPAFVLPTAVDTKFMVCSCLAPSTLLQLASATKCDLLPLFLSFEDAEYVLLSTLFAELFRGLSCSVEVGDNVVSVLLLLFGSPS